MSRYVVFILVIFPVFIYAQSPKKAKWNFKNLDGWVYTQQDKNPSVQYEINNGKLKIFTRAGSEDRKKMRTKDKIYTTGRYTWKTYIPEMGAGDRSSIGCWLYCDDKHEIDFEIGPGKDKVRAGLNASHEELIGYMTTQGNPYHTATIKIKPGWHVFEIDITLVDGKYKVDWIIDKIVLSSVLQTYGKEIAFYIYCSVENLKFLGEHPATKDNYALFDYVKYKYHE